MPRSRKSPPQPEWLTSTQAGLILGVSNRSVVRLIKDGKLPARVTAGRQFRIDRADVERFAAETQYVPATQDPEPTEGGHNPPPS